MVNTKRLFVFILIGMFMFSMIGSVVGAEVDGGEKSSILDKVISIISDSGSAGSETFITDEGKANFSKVLLIALVILLVYAITSEMPFLKSNDKSFIRGIVSIIVGVLSFLFVSTDDILAILTNYEALGIALTSLIPLAIMIWFFYELKKGDSTWGTVLSKFAFILFGIYSVWKWITYTGDSPLVWMYLLTAIAAGIWVLIEKKVWKMFKKAEYEKNVETLNDEVNAQDAKRKIEAKSFEGGGEI